MWAPPDGGGMSTTAHIRIGAAATAAVAVALVTVHVRPASAQAGANCGVARTMLAADAPETLKVTRTLGHTAAQPAAYDWPLKPFDRQHPVRANLDDPRIGNKGSRAFHFGIDIAAPDGTPVYATTAGTVYLRPGSIAVAPDLAHGFGYWHVVPVVENHQYVRRHQLLGHIAPGWGHVHFDERVDGVYLNPLRPGGLGPYADLSAPEIREIALVHVRNGVQILANAYDLPSPRVPGAWTNEPVSPALLRWRIVRNGRVAGPWQTAADFRSRMIDARRFGSIYATPTRQNHKGEAGLYCFYLAHAWQPADGSYRIEVAASDIRGNRAIAGVGFTVVEGAVRR